MENKYFDLDNPVHARVFLHTLKLMQVDFAYSFEGHENGAENDEAVVWAAKQLYKNIFQKHKDPVA